MSSVGAVDARGAGGPQRGRRVEREVVAGGVDVEPEPDDDAVARPLAEQAGELAVVVGRHEDVVGPLQRRRRRRRTSSTARCTARPASSGTHEAPDGRGRHEHRHREAGAGGRRPGATEAAATGILLLGDDHAPGRGARPRPRRSSSRGGRTPRPGAPRVAGCDGSLVERVGFRALAHEGKARLASMSKSDTHSIGGTDVPKDIDTTTTAGKLADLKRRVAEVANAGSERAVEKQHARGKKTARERLEMLLDEGSFVEMDKYARHRSVAFGRRPEPPLRRRRRHRLRHGRRPHRRGVRPGLHRLRRLARRGVRREDRARSWTSR